MCPRNLKDAVVWNVIRLVGNASEEDIRRVYSLLGKMFPSLPEDPIAARAYKRAFGAQSTLPAVFRRIVHESNPIGRGPDPNLMSTPEQRNRLREAVWRAGKTKPLFIGDFWNDGPLARRCMAGGRAYFHINVHGDYEPCVFQQFALDNVRDKSIREVIESDCFRDIREATKDFRHNWFCHA